MRQFAYFSCFEDAFCIENIALWLALQNTHDSCVFPSKMELPRLPNTAPDTKRVIFTLPTFPFLFFIMLCFLYLSFFLFWSFLFFSFVSLVLIFPSLIFLFLCVFFFWPFLFCSFLNFLVLMFCFFPFLVFTYFSSPFVLSSKLWKLQVSQQNFLWQSSVDCTCI